MPSIANAPILNEGQYTGRDGRNFIRESTRDLQRGALSEIELTNMLAPFMSQLIQNLIESMRPENIAAQGGAVGRQVAGAGKKRARAARATNPNRAEDIAFEADNQGALATGDFIGNAMAPGSQIANAAQLVDLTDPVKLTRRYQMIANQTQNLAAYKPVKKPGFLQQLVGMGANLYGAMQGNPGSIGGLLGTGDGGGGGYNGSNSEYLPEPVG